MLKPNTEVKRTNGVKLNRNTSLFEVEQSGLQNFNAKMWVQSRNGRCLSLRCPRGSLCHAILDMSITLAETATGGVSVQHAIRDLCPKYRSKAGSYC